MPDADRVSGRVIEPGHGFTRGIAVRLDADTGRWTRGRAGDVGVGLVGSVFDADTFEFVQGGELDGLADLTPGAVYYIGANGVLSTTRSGAPVFQARTTTAGYVLMGQPSVDIATQIAQAQATGSGGATVGGGVTGGTQPEVNAGYLTADAADELFLTPEEAAELFLTTDSGDDRYLRIDAWVVDAEAGTFLVDIDHSVPVYDLDGGGPNLDRIVIDEEGGFASPTGTAVFVAGVGDASPSQTWNPNETPIGGEANYDVASWPVNTGGATGFSYRVRFQGTLNYSADSTDPVNDDAQAQTFVATQDATAWANFASNGADAMTDNGSDAVRQTFPGLATPETHNVDVEFDVDGGKEVRVALYAGLTPMLGIPQNCSIVGSFTLSVTQLTGIAADTWNLSIDAGTAADEVDVYAKPGSYPSGFDDPDATYVGRFPLDEAGAAVVAWENSDATMKFIAIPRRGTETGPVGELT